MRLQKCLWVVNQNFHYNYVTGPAIVSILVIAYHTLKNRASYHELGGDYFDRRNVEQLQARYIRKLEALGLKVSVEGLPDAAWFNRCYFSQSVIFRAGEGKTKRETDLRFFDSPIKERSGGEYKVTRIDNDDYVVVEGFENSPGRGLYWQESAPTPPQKAD